ncbi:MAG: PEP-CTERM sorting domain-containing protein [Planctomycetaceae bacterium]|nr:PEP-CTERM sorting domain-containing protein [Planctomycetaceae bacterium]
MSRFKPVLALLIAATTVLFLTAGQSSALVYVWAGHAAEGIYVANDWSNPNCWPGGMTGIVAGYSTAHYVGSSGDLAGSPYNPAGNIQLGYEGTVYGGSAGNGTLSVESGTLTSGTVALGRIKYGPGNTGSLVIDGGTLISSGVNLGASVAGNTVIVSSGTLDLGAGGTNHAIAITPYITTTFSGGTIRNLTTAQINSISGSGTVSNLTGLLTMNLGTAGTFSGNITGSGAGNVVSTGAMLNLAPVGDMNLVGLQSTANVEFTFNDLGTDLVTIGSGGLAVDPGTVLNFGTLPASGTFNLFAGNISGVNLSNFVAPTGYTLSDTVNPGFIALTSGSVPEPATMLLLGIGGVAALIRRRRS